MSTLIAISCTTQKDIYDDYKTLQIVINIEDYIEWLNEDLFQGNVTQEEYNAMKENYEETLTLSKELK